MQRQSELAAALEQLADMARVRRPDDTVLAEFLPRYYEELPAFDVDDRRLDDVYAVAATHLDLGRIRSPGHSIVRVLSPERDREGWHSPRSVVLVVTDDVPFMVDTVRMAIDRHGLRIHLLVHPMLSVTRGTDDQISEFGAGGPVEAWTQIEIDRCDPELATELETEIASAVAEVHHVVDDFQPTQQRMASLAEHDPLVAWLAKDHFVFLGAADYERADDGALTPIAGTALGELSERSVIDPPPAAGDSVVVIARTDTVSAIHRPERMICIAIRPPGTAVEHRFVGLLGSTAYRMSVFDIPTVGDRAQAVLDLSDASPDSYLGRAVRTVLETLPRELLFELDAHPLAELVIRIVGLHERQLVRVFEVPEVVGHWRTVLVYLPRTRLAGGTPPQVADMVAEAYGGERRDVATVVATSLARISMTVRHDPEQALPDLDELRGEIDTATTSWTDRLRQLLSDELGEQAARTLFEQVGRYVPTGYRGVVAPERAIGDLQQLAALLSDSTADLSSTLVRDIDAPEGEWRFRVYRRGLPIALADLLPLLDHLGLVALDERPYEFRTPAGDLHLYDIGVRSIGDVHLDDPARAELHRAFEALMNGDVEADGFNRLIVRAGLTTREVAILRAYARYLRQMGFAFSQQYIEATVAEHPGIASRLIDLFKARFDPAVADDRRDELTETAREAVVQALDGIPSLDQDRICRAFLTLIDATTRTNVWRDRTAIAFKFDPERIPDLPAPRPKYEIWVCSPRVEGVHLRAGTIARGGLRWSDRREDFRTEVLGLMKTQVVKNAVIVPVGAKGGFVVKRPPADREGLRQAGVECYRTFVRGMLDLIDNFVGGEVVRPPHTVCHDGDDTYLVVAADKGTAAFSDIANGVAAEYDYWLGDAFASGGSSGYDHKDMGITARGAWESVRRHAAVIGKDADHDTLTAVGIGDMSGDVFGNGMLRSPHLKLVAAFDHRDIFIDPDPAPADTFEERKRLYELPRSTWQDYDTRLISPGGGVYSRAQKSITLSDAARAALDAPAGPLTPHQVISAILRAPVDMLWNGGIGTYVKASTETHDHVGDRANDGLRIDGRDLRCRLVGEGGNLGFTQLGRIEYALAGGLINTDAIDNSAGVDSSDREVNLKILLNGPVADGELTVKQRNELLHEMTEDVAEQVLDDNRAQTLALMIANRQSLPMANVHARYLDALESDGRLDRALEFMPTDKQIAERQSINKGLQAPEFAVLIAYTKNANIAEITSSDLPDDPALERNLFAYFPPAVRERYPDAIRSHRLRREIISTMVVNEMVNLSGISFDHRMTEETGSGLAEVARAWACAREVVDFHRLWDEIEALRHTVANDVRLELFLDCRRMNERSALWLLRHRHPPFDIAGTAEYFRKGVRELAAGLPSVVSGRMADVMRSQEAARLAAGVPESLAERSSVWRLLHTGFDLVDVAAASRSTVLEAARTYWEVFERLDLMWLWDGVGALPRSTRWQTQARSALRDDLLTALTDLTAIVLRAADGDLEAWVDHNQRPLGRVQAMFTEIRRAETFDVTNLSVALRQLRNLALTSVYPG